MNIDEKKYPELYSLRKEIKAYTREFLRRERWKLSLLFLLIVGGCCYGTYSFYKQFPASGELLNKDYVYHVKTKVWANIAAPVNIKIPIDQVFDVPFNETLNLSVPFKATVPIPIHDSFEIPISEPVAIRLDHSFPVKETIHLKTVLPLDSTVNVGLFGIRKDIAVKADVPVDANIPLDQSFRLNDTFSFNVNDPLNVFVDNTFQVPIDTIFNVSIPLDIRLSVPLKFDFKTSIDIKEKIPIIIEFDVVMNPRSGVKIEGLSIDGEVLIIK